MTRLAMIALTLILICVTMSCRQEEPIPPPEDLTGLALQFVDSMVVGDFESATHGFTSGMKEALPAEELGDTWASIISGNGPLRRLGGVRATESGSFLCVFVKCEFERAKLDVKVVFDRNNKIAGVWFVKPDPTKSYEPVAQTSVRLMEQQSVETDGAKEVVRFAKRFIGLLAKGDFGAAVGCFDEVMAEKMPATRLARVWADLVEENGPFQKQGGTWTERYQGMEAVFATVQFEKAFVELKVVIDQKNKICGFWLAKVKPIDGQTERLGQEFVELLANGDFGSAVKMFSAEMKEGMPAWELGEAWKTIISRNGPFKRVIKTRLTREGGFDCVHVTCEFEDAKLDVEVVFNEKREVGGLWFKPVGEYKPPEYADRASFSERRVIVGKGGEWELPGTLSVPKGAGRFAAVVLVHGSGPNDRDETIGPHKPFKDLAWGLASRGIAVLRYDKRTLIHRGRLGRTENFTVKEEAIDDALAAVSLLRSTEQIDAKRVFVIGHSLGGNLVPRIGRRDASIAGLISMAGSTRPTEELLLEQIPYLLSLDGDLSERDKEELETLKEQVARIRDPDLSPDTPAKELPHAVPASYWLDLRGYNPAELAKTLDMPMLVLHGARDYQVTIEDFEDWKEHLSNRADVTFKLYPKLNHHFMVGTGEGKSTPREYDIPENIALEVIEDIARWVNKH